MDRLTDLEIRYAHMERLLSELSDVLFAQQRAIDTLERRVKDLETRAPEGAGPSRDGEDPERPPHY
jgi:SlyX protein